jgi:hypothetical protein
MKAVVIPARKVLWLCLIVFLPHSAMAASDIPGGYYLKDIKTISYILDVKKTMGGDQCNIDEENLKTSIEFVANQSTKLKIVPPEQKDKRVNELMGWQPEDKEAATKFHDWNFMPFFNIEIQPIQASQFMCTAATNAGVWVTVDVKKAHVIPTQAVLSYPGVEIYEFTGCFWGPPQTFSNQAINAAEQMMKHLVNDWSAAQ